MKLHGCDRLQLLLMGALAAGVFGPARVSFGGDPSTAIRPAPLAGSQATTVQPVATTPGQKSEVMRQLERLYQQDGREMPELNTNIRPVPTTDPAAPAATAAPARPAAPASGQTLRTQQPLQQSQTAPTAAAPVAAPSAPGAPPAQETPKPTNRVVAFFKKLLPGHKDPKPTRPPAEYRPDIAPVPPATLAGGGLGVPAAPASSLPLLDKVARSPFADAEADPLPAPLAELPAPGAPAELPAPAESLPPLLTEPKVAAATTDDPFSEMSEAEADKALTESPFTGLTLDEEPRPAASSDPVEALPDLEIPPAAETPAATPAEDPFADELEKMGLLPPAAESTPAAEPVPAVETTAPETVPEASSETPVATPQEPAAAPPTELPALGTPATDSPTFEGIEDAATREKMKKIHERGSMKGLKGFCPVSLRDQRELIDAKPDFHSTFRGQKFHFADADAKLKFDEEPARYAPAAYGADVVALTRDNDVVEGSLDHAAWFKGRLYLFGSAESHDTFVADPSKFATPVGIE